MEPLESVIWIGAEAETVMVVCFDTLLTFSHTLLTSGWSHSRRYLTGRPRAHPLRKLRGYNITHHFCIAFLLAPGKPLMLSTPTTSNQMSAKSVQNVFVSASLLQMCIHYTQTRVKLPCKCSWTKANRTVVEWNLMTISQVSYHISCLIQRLSLGCVFMGLCLYACLCSLLLIKLFINYYSIYSDTLPPLVFC